MRLAPRTVLPEVTIPPSVTPGHDVTTLIIDTSRKSLGVLGRHSPASLCRLFLTRSTLTSSNQHGLRIAVISSTRFAKLTSSQSFVRPRFVPCSRPERSLILMLLM